jgi:hypothetical protein
MREFIAVAVLTALFGGERIEEIKWLSAQTAFENANDPKAPRWVLIYKEWPG